MKKNLFYSKTQTNINQKKMKTQHYLLLLAIFVLTTSFTIACKKSNDNKPLVNTYWQLTHIEGETVTKSPAIPCIQFLSDGTFNGNLGCNSFFGNYFAKRKKISFDYLGATKKYCQDMKMEDHFGKVIRNGITHYKIEKDTLILLNKKTEVLRFIAATQKEEQ